MGALGNPLHEVGHWVAYRLGGLQPGYSLSGNYLFGGQTKTFTGVAAGPLVSLLAALLGLWLLYRVPRLARFGAALGIIMPFSRLFTYLLAAVFPLYFPIDLNDEGFMAWHFFSLFLPKWSVAIILTSLLLAVMIKTWRGLRGAHHFRALLFAAGMLTFIGMSALQRLVIDPLLFPYALPLF